MGIELEELIELLIGNHEGVFLYKGNEYVVQPEVREKGTYEVIWQCTPEPKCIGEVLIPPDGLVPREKIMQTLNLACIDGKSFIDLQKEIRVDYIY